MLSFNLHETLAIDIILNSVVSSNSFKGYQLSTGIKWGNQMSPAVQSIL